MYPEAMNDSDDKKNIAVFCAAAEGARPEYRVAAEELGQVGGRSRILGKPVTVDRDLEASAHRRGDARLGHDVELRAVAERP